MAWMLFGVGVLGVFALLSVLFPWLRRRELAANRARRAPIVAAGSFEERVRAAGLGAHLEALRSAARPSLRVVLGSEGSPALGRSRFGGRPDLPQGVEWPARDGRPLAFLAQLDLAELASHERGTSLPRKGRLWFFYDLEQMPWGYEPGHAGGWAVLHDESTELAPRDLPQTLSREVRLTASSITLVREVTLPPPESPEADALGLATEAWDAYDDLQSVLAGGDEEAPIHRVLGWPDAIQGDMALECELVQRNTPRTSAQDPEVLRAAQEWRLLLQVDTDESLGTSFGDSGRLYFLIRDADLADARFDAVWCVLQCF